jgi:hypothetical protein
MSNQPYLRFNLNAGPSGRRPSAAQLVQLIRTEVSANHLPPGSGCPPCACWRTRLAFPKTPYSAPTMS